MEATNSPAGRHATTNECNTESIARECGDRSDNQYEAPDYSHAAFVTDYGFNRLETELSAAGESWLEVEYGQPLTLEANARWHNPFKTIKRDYRARQCEDASGRPRLHLVIHDFKSGENITFDDYDVFDKLYRDWLEQQRALTDAERKDLQARQAERQEAAEREARTRAERAKRLAQEHADEEARRENNRAADREVWAGLPERGTSTYLRRKGLPHVVPFRYERQTLVTPLWSAMNEFGGLQRVKGGGRKLFTDGAHKKAHFTVIGGDPALEGRLDKRDLPRFIAEGVATAVRPQQVYGEQVIVAYDAHNITEVIRAICTALNEAGMHKERRAWLQRLIILADNDAWKAKQVHNGVALGNVGLEAAHAAAFEADKFGVRIACPDFSGLSLKSEPTDFDDLAQLAGENWQAVVREQTDAATLAYPNLVFARRKRLYLRDHARKGGTFSPVVDLTRLRDGLNIGRSPQSTQKTRGLIPLVEQCHRQGQIVIYVCPRVSLVGDAARTLKLEMYSDHDRSDLTFVRGLAITTNSLHHLEDAAGNLTAPYLLVIDESELTIESFTGSHMKSKEANLRVMSRLVARAQRVVALDADAGELTRWAFTTWRPGERINWLNNHWDVGVGKTSVVYPHRAQPYEQLEAGVWGATDGIAESRRLAFTLATRGVKTQLINGETSSDPDNLTFLNDINRHAPTVGAIVGSPSVPTGVSLTDLSYTRTVGIFYGANGPATEALQAMWRARRASDWHIWTQPSVQQEHAIDLDARYGAALDAELAHLGNPEHLAKRGDDYGYADLKGRVAKRNRWARTTFGDDLIWLMVRQGVDVRLAPRPTEDASPALSDLLVEARTRERQAYAEERYGAESYALDKIVALRGCGSLTSRERYAVERFDHTDYFRNADETDLKTWLLADYRGRYRRQLGHLEQALGDEETVRAYALQHLDTVEMREDTPLTLQRREFHKQVLAATGFERAVTALYTVLTPDELDEAARWDLQGRSNGQGDELPPVAVRLRAVTLERFERYTTGSAAIQTLILYIEANRAVLAGVVSLPTPEKLAANPVRYLGSWLKSLGLRQARVGKNENLAYALEGASLVLAAHVFERRGKGTLFSKTPLSKESVPAENTALYEYLRAALLYGVFRHDRQRDLLLESYRLADGGDEKARAALTLYLSYPEVQQTVGRSA